MLEGDKPLYNFTPFIIKGGVIRALYANDTKPKICHSCTKCIIVGRELYIPMNIWFLYPNPLTSSYYSNIT